MKLVTEVVPELPLSVHADVFRTDAALDQVGATPLPPDNKISPLVPGKLLGISAPLNFTFPVTSSTCVGAWLPIPTLPFPSIRICSLVAESVPPVTKITDFAGVAVPIN